MVQSLDRLKAWSSSGTSTAIGTQNNSQTINNYDDDKDESLGKKNIFPDNAFEVNKDLDGSIKYSFDTIYDDKELIDIASDYYAERDGDKFESTRDVVDEFVSDRTWKQAHTLSMTGELLYVLNDDTSVEQRQRLSYLQNYWNSLPNFYAEGGRGWWAGLSSNIVAGMADPLNYVGGFVGGQVAKQTMKAAGKEIVKKAVQKKLKTQAVVKGTGIAMVADATIFGGADAILQSTEKEIGMREQYDPLRTGYASVLGAGTTLLPSIAGAYFAGKRSLKQQANKEGVELDNYITETTGVASVDKIVNKTKSGMKKDTPFDKTEKGPSIISKYEQAKQQAFDTHNPIKNVYETVHGREFSIESLKKDYGIIKKAKKEGKSLKGFVDPILNPYAQFRMLVGSMPRADAFIKNGVKLQRKDTVAEFGYDATGNKGLLQIMKPFGDKGQHELFGSYIGALHSQGIRKNAIKKTVGKERNSYLTNTKYSKKEAEDVIDFIELPFDKYKAKYPEGKYKETPNKPTFVDEKGNPYTMMDGAKDYQKFTIDLAKYSMGGDILDNVQFKNMIKAHPFYMPNFVNGVAHSVDSISSADRVVKGVGSPAKKKLKGGVDRAEVKPFMEAITDYTFATVIAADKNFAKKQLYKLYDAGIKNGTLKKDEVVREITGAKLIPVKRAIVKTAIEKLEELGVKVDKASIEKSVMKGDGVSSFQTMAFADSLVDKAGVMGAKKGQKIDTFYDNGKLRAFIIEDEGVAKMYQDYDSATDAMLNAISRYTQPFARIPSQAITWSPPFIAFNGIRDTLSGAVNSAFGFVPFYTTIRGGLKTMRGIDNPANIKSYIDMFKRSDALNDAMVAGMGYTTRKDTEKFLNFKALDALPPSAATGYYKKSLRHLANFVTATPRGWGEFVTRVEYATRLGEFELAKKAGFSDVGAAFAGREVATDFAMKGGNKKLQIYSRNTMFFNAGLQGFYRGLRRAGEGTADQKFMVPFTDKGVNKKFGSMVGLTVVAPALGLWALNNERREYEEVPDEVKQLSNMIPIFEDEKDDGSHLWENGQRKIKFYFPLPKPYDFGVFGNIAIAIAEMFQEKSPGIGISMMFKSLNQVMPGAGFYRGGQGGTNIGGVSIPFFEEPAFLRPWSDLANNHDWIGSKITPYGLDKLPPHLRIKTNTRESIIQFAAFMNHITSEKGGRSFLQGIPVLNKLINPIEMDYIVNSYMTGLLSYPLDLIDAGVWKDDKFGERTTSRDDESDLRRKPWSIVTRRFKVNTPVKSSQNMRTLYKIKEKADEVMATDSERTNSLRNLLDITGFKDSYTNEKAQQLRGVSQLLSDGMQVLAESRKRRDDIRFMKDLSGDEKRKQIEELRQVENDIAYYLIKSLSEANFDKVMKNNFGGNKYTVPKEQTEIPVVTSVMESLFGLKEGE